MISFEEVGFMLDHIADALPEGFYRELNGGIVLLPEEKLHPASAGRTDLYILGEYHHEPGGLGRYIAIYYGSFIRAHGYLSTEQQQETLRHILVHEFTHHLESLAGERGLEIQDAKDLAKYKEGQNI